MSELKEEVYLDADSLILYLIDQDRQMNLLLDADNFYVTTTQYAIYEALYSIGKKELNLENLRRILEKVEIVPVTDILSNFIPNKITSKRIRTLRKRAGVNYEQM